MNTSYFVTILSFIVMFSYGLVGAQETPPDDLENKIFENIL